jgi:hypothetical protein
MGKCSTVSFDPRAVLQKMQVEYIGYGMQVPA